MSSKPNPDRERIMDMFYAGYTYSEIARLTNQTRNAIAGLVHRHRVNDPDPVKAAARLTSMGRHCANDAVNRI